jgi:putative tricarboxylic transport membrane protein
MMDGNGISALFCLLVALYVMWKGVELGFGGFHEPGAGFFPIFGGLILLVTSTALMIQSFLSKLRTGERETHKGNEVNIALVAYTCVCLIVYSLIFEWLGFIISTFLLGMFLLRVMEHKKWWVHLLTSATVSLATYVIFNSFLKSELPKGILEIFF